jgi:hypothetical protein
LSSFLQSAKRTVSRLSRGSVDFMKNFRASPNLNPQSDKLLGTHAADFSEQ